ncbi:MAG: aquaporin family protein [Chitinophagaceae bacterium]|nr:aquaporin family protein [Chitinophagaceae bacterium]MBK8786052.1 aquaporin family protein [Chitinophagaceae bacterium]MBK9485353.1 aquaporin family protein [Chitinophagaceae bacterium]MBL0199928.1 aquaporin family protein [Chitinophagaceae bacterium]
MNNFLFELIGTAFLILLGNGVVANVVLNKTKGNNGGWIVITFGWAMAVFVGVYVAAAKSGAHLNPAVTIALAAADKFEWALVPVQIAGQFAGAMIGSFLVWVTYKKHFDETEDADARLAVFCTSPAIPNILFNVATEIIGTFALVFGVFFITGADAGLHSLDALPVALLVLAIGLSLGGPTGYAINPARDLGPRIMHFILPMKDKGSSGWGYSWIPVVGPVIGGILAALVFKML